MELECKGTFSNSKLCRVSSIQTIHTISSNDSSLSHMESKTLIFLLAGKEEIHLVFGLAASLKMNVWCWFTVKYSSLLYKLISNITEFTHDISLLFFVTLGHIKVFVQ